MAHHKSAQKRIRQDAKKRLHNRYYKKTMRNALQSFRELTDGKEAEKAMSDLISKIDKLAKRNMIHKKKAGNLKSGIMKQVAALNK